MADLALITANQINVVGEPEVQRTGVAGVNIVAGQSVMIDPATGAFVLADSARAYGMALRTAFPGTGLTVIRLGLIDGFNLAALAWDDPIYMNPANGVPASGAGTPSVLIGRVYTGLYNLLGNPADKLMEVNFLRL
jgi:hypothetical protein